MKSKLHRQNIIMVFLFALIFTFITIIPSFADSINNIYDDLNRLIRIENTTDGKVVEYQYDEVGNRLLIGTYEPLTITATAGDLGGRP